MMKMRHHHTHDEQQFEEIVQKKHKTEELWKQTFITPVIPV